MDEVLLSATAAADRVGVTPNTINLWSLRGILMPSGRREVLRTVAVEGHRSRFVTARELERFLKVTASERGPGAKPRRRRRKAKQEVLSE
jgi:hypothetical protein